MVFHFKRKTIIIASVICIGVCGAVGGVVAGIYSTGQYPVSNMQTELLSQGTLAESIQESVGESNGGGICTITDHRITDREKERVY